MEKTIEKKYEELAQDVISFFKYYWERKEHLDYISEVCGDPKEMEPELEEMYSVVDTLAAIKNNAGLSIDTKWYEDKRAEVRKEVDDNIDFYKKQYRVDQPTPNDLYRTLRHLAKEYPQAAYPFDQYAELVDDQEKYALKMEDALSIAAKEYHKDMCKFVPDNYEIAMPDEMVAHWKGQAGILSRKKDKK